MPKLNCKNCNQKCCEGYIMNNITNDFRIILPKKITKICVEGIQLMRVSRTKWKCRFFKRNKCAIYKNRPWICEYWFCKDHPKKLKKFLASSQNNSLLGFQVITKGRK